VSFTDINDNAKKVVSNKQYKSMGKISFTTPDRMSMDLEKTFSLDGNSSILNSSPQQKEANLNSVSQELRVLKESLKTRSQKQSAEKKEPLKTVENQIAVQNTEVIDVPEVPAATIQTINAVVHAQNYIVQELSDTFEKKFEKFDEIIVELIRCKTENERLKQKVDNLTRDNYKYKKEVESYKSIVPGLYIKKETDKTKF